MLERLQKDGYVRYENLPLETRDGRKIAVEFVSNVYQAGDKKVIQCNVRDITERRRLETALIHFRSIIESSDDAIMGKDLNGIVTSWNKGAEKIFGYTADEMVGASIMRLIPDDRREEEGKTMETLSRGESLDNFETRQRTKGGRLISVSITASPIKDLNGKIIGVSKVAHDITMRKEHEHEIERLSRLYAALSHVNQTIVTLNNREELFTRICRGLVEIGKLRMAWVGWLDAKTRQVIPVAQWGDGMGYLSRVTIYADDRPEGQGPIGTAIHEERNYICNDFSHDPRTLMWRKMAEQASFQSSASLLIRQGGVICGAITVYAGETDFFQDKEIALLEEAAADISFALDNFVREEARRQAETELRWKTAFLEAQVDSSLDGILVVDDHGKKILQNQCLNELWKIPPEIVGNKDDSAQVEFVADRTKYPREFADKVVYLNTHPDEVSRDEIELIDGTFLDRYSSPVRDQAGKHYGRIWNFRDITERKRAEESLRLLESAVKQSKESIVITDAGLDFPGPKIIFANPAFTQMTGYTAAEVIGKSPRFMQGPRTDKAVLRRLRKNLEQGEAFAGEAINYRKDGTEFDLEWQIAPLRDASGKVTHFVATQHDITERKKLEQQFRQSQKMESIGTLAGGVAHDFNNILAVIQMQAGLLKSEGGLSAAQSELADDIGSAVQRAVGLTRQLLLFSRTEVLQSRDLDLNQNVTEMTKMLKRILGENIAVQLNLAAQPMLLHADAGMMDQVLMNLAVNARDAMLNGGQLVIETAGVEFDEFAATQTALARIGSFVRLSVSDNGCGIPPENLAKIFEPFFTTKGVGKGTGLGLATVFGIAQQHHGWVNVYSEGGHGTTFKVYLPRLSESHDTKIIKKLPATAQTGHETILLVEDEPALRTMMAKSLSRFGYRVLEASTGFKALEVWKEHPAKIHLLLTDLMMPDGMTGKELGQRLLEKNPKLKVIYMSGYSADIVAKDFPLQEGVNFLVKPFQSQKLAETIRDCLDNSSTV
jgi:two-component system cell cycle sensor histidine kinase/response regulator CckA